MEDSRIKYLISAPLAEIIVAGDFNVHKKNWLEEIKMAAKLHGVDGWKL